MATKPTLNEIAAYCNVDKSTVSRVLNNRLGSQFSVRPELEVQIRDAAERLKYRPNFLARSLVNQRTALITILRLPPEPGETPSIYEKVITHIALHLKEAGYEICTGYLMSDASSRQLPSWQSDGVIVLQGSEPGLLQELEDARMPYVCVNCESGPSGHAILVDDAGGVELGMNHLLGLGHRRIGYRGTQRHPEHRSVAARYQGYLDMLARNALAPAGPYNQPELSPEAFLHEVVEAEVTAVLAYDHVEAIQLLYAARSLRIEVPRQLSLICFNDEYPCNLIWPALTTIALPSEEMARKAAELLVDRMKHPEKRKRSDAHLMMPERLVVRESTVEPV